MAHARSSRSPALPPTLAVEGCPCRPSLVPRAARRAPARGDEHIGVDEGQRHLVHPRSYTSSRRHERPPVSLAAVLVGAGQEVRHAGRRGSRPGVGGQEAAHLGETEVPSCRARSRARFSRSPSIVAVKLATESVWHQPRGQARGVCRGGRRHVRGGRPAQAGVEPRRSASAIRCSAERRRVSAIRREAISRLRARSKRAFSSRRP